MARNKPSSQSSTRSDKDASGRASGHVRVISGRWRGRKLPVRDVTGLRPTTDRVKETLFNWLAADIRDSRCLDLFAGSGSLGFEALSRYAAYVMMVELDRGAAAQLASNLATLQCQEGRVVQQDALSLLSGPSEPFDIVFLDPPFRKDLLEGVCSLLESRGWLSDNALIYIEREKEALEPQFPANWQLCKDKQAGQVRYQLYQRESITP
ncbi:MAG: 16S rRNA (guanine(966)-N(2))-methyltransferase RsmD [Aeromonadaceae bacterium]|nr:16S rRNA (guanine(966)-N(2))-methyltransferase RsmD [Aeromonadaceae bacterium]